MTNLEQAESLIGHIYANSRSTNETLLKANVIRVAADHRDKCSGAECNISLTLLRELAENAGIQFTTEEVRLFL